MALEKNMNVEYESGAIVQADRAYIRIESYNGNKNTATIYVNSYLSKQNYNDGKNPLEATQIFSFSHSVEDNAPNTVKQGYEYLKTLAEFSDSIDA